MQPFKFLVIPCILLAGMLFNEAYAQYNPPSDSCTIEIVQPSDGTIYGKNNPPPVGSMEATAKITVCGQDVSSQFVGKVTWSIVLEEGIYNLTLTGPNDPTQWLTKPGYVASVSYGSEWLAERHMETHRYRVRQ